MAHKKGLGSSRNGRDSNAKRLGVKIFAGQKVKEKVVNVVGKVLKNRRREEVATVVPVSGPLANPKAGTLETVLKLVENAFIKAILPGFEKESAVAIRQR